MSEVIRGVIDKSTAQDICDAVKEKEGSTEGVPFNTVAARIRALSVGGGENKLVKVVERSVTEITAEDLEGVTSIGEYAFYGCSNLTSVTIPDSVIYIGDSVFYKCTSLESVTIPNGVTSIGKYAFRECSNLMSVTVPNSVTSIGQCAFYDCVSLTDVTIPEGIIIIDEYTFFRCESLIDITIPNSVTSIGVYAFASCDNLESLYYNGNVTSWCHMNLGTLSSLPFANKKAKLYIRNTNGEYELLTNLVTPNTVTEIKPRVFRDNRHLTSVTIGDSVTSIGDEAFTWCENIESLTIGNGTTSIGNSAFSYCKKLKSVKIGNGITSLNSRAFTSCNALTDIYIDAPEDSISGAPWGAPKSPTIHWNTPLPSEEV